MTYSHFQGQLTESLQPFHWGLILIQVHSIFCLHSSYHHLKLTQQLSLSEINILIYIHLCLFLHWNASSIIAGTALLITVSSTANFNLKQHIINTSYVEVTTYLCPGCALGNTSAYHRTHGVIQCTKCITIWKLCQFGNNFTIPDRSSVAYIIVTIVG